MNAALRSIVVGTAGLDVAAVAALVLTVRRAPRGVPPDFLRLGWIVVAIQCAHFSEEWFTQFEVHFPVLLGLGPWPEAFFVWFNLAWLAIWSGALLLVRTSRAALFPLWFLAIAAVANGIAHPLACVVVGGYFPGLVTAPALGLAGAFLFSRIMAFTVAA